MTIMTDLQAHLIANIDGLTTDNVKIDYLPASPNNAVKLLNYGGSYGDQPHYVEHNIQIMARNESSATCHTLITSIRDLLASDYNSKAINGTVRHVKILTEPAFLKNDNNLTYRTFNIRIL